MKAKSIPPIDGAYVVLTKVYAVDGRVLLGPKTRDQRKIARELAARGQFCGFYPAVKG